MINKNILIFFFFLFLNLIFSQTESLRVISPNGGEKLQQNTNYSISWASNNIDWISIYYRLDANSEWEIITSKVSADLGSYSWKVPNETTDNLAIKIESKNVFDISDATVSIVEELFINKKIFETTETNTIRIMPLGNSITFDNRQNDNRAVEDKIGYRFPLYNLLKQNGYTFEFVGSQHSGSNFFHPETEYDANAGFPGIRDDQLYTLLRTGRRYQPQNNIDQTITTGRYLNTYPADIILLHIGTNGNEQLNGTNAADVENILDEIDLYEDSTGTEIFVFLARIIDRVPNESYVTELNDNVENMVFDRVNNPLNDAFPDKIIMVDMEDSADISYNIDYMGTIGNGIVGDMSDFLHCNDKGYVKMAQTWFNSLQTLINSPPIILSNPSSKYVITGDTVQFSVSAEGTSKIDFQWMKNGLELFGENDSILILENVSLEDNLSNFTCKISSIGGVTETDSAFLIVTDQNLRVSHSLRILYNFDEGSGNTIFDSQNDTEKINLSINTPNNIEWLNYGLSILSPSSISSSTSTSKIFQSIKNSNEITVELWINPTKIIQNGPARIITYSKNSMERNFGLFQNNDRYEFRLRTTATDNNGIPAIISDADKVNLSPTHFVCTHSIDDTTKIFINGKLEKKVFLNGTFDNWDSTFVLAIANELIDNKPWLGTYYLTAIYDRALTTSEIEHNYLLKIEELNDISAPSELSAYNTQNGIELSWKDNSTNEEGFIIYRKNSLLGEFEALDSVSTNISNFLDELIEEGKKYSYAICAYNDFSISDTSNKANVISGLPAPSNLEGVVNDSGHVELTWLDNSQNEIGFVIEGRPSLDGSYFSPIDTINAESTSFIDSTSKMHTPYLYRIYCYSLDTVSSYSNEISLNVVDVYSSKLIENRYLLFQNYPNPFNPKTTIKYYIPEESLVSLVVYNILGQPITELVNKNQKIGDYNIDFEGSSLSSGIYFYRLKAISINTGQQFDSIKKFLLLK